MDKNETYCKIRDKALSCKDCDLGDYDNGEHDQHVFGDGNLNAKIMFIAENPGKHETINRECLTSDGVSGSVYQKILDALNLIRSDVYTTNVLVCKTPSNRDAEPWEVKKCEKYLKAQIDLVKPELVVTFGRFAAQALLGNFKITKEHGQIRESEKYSVPVFPLYHPAYVKSYASIGKRKEFKRDVINLRKIVSEMFA